MRGAEEGASAATVFPAATVVLVRDAPTGLETLLVRRAPTLRVGAGMWVFPGGRVDPGDHATDAADAADGPDATAMIAAAARAAVREAREEVGLHLDVDGLVQLSHWLAPDTLAQRFATWFFLAEAPDGEVVVDGSETTDHLWVPPAAALARRDRGALDLLPPTWVTLHDVAAHATVADALADAASRVPPWYQTRIVTIEGGRIALLPGDAGYETRDPAVPGARHRLVMSRTPWSFERVLAADAAIDRVSRQPRIT